MKTLLLTFALFNLALECMGRSRLDTRAENLENCLLALGEFLRCHFRLLVEDLQPEL